MISVEIIRSLAKTAMDGLARQSQEALTKRDVSKSDGLWSGIRAVKSLVEEIDKLSSSES